MEEQVKTVFKVADESSAPLKQMARNGEQVDKSFKKAKQSADALGKTPMGVGKETSAAHPTSMPMKPEGGHAGGGHEEGGEHHKKSGWMDKLDDAQREEFMEQKQELQLRKARVRGQKLEMAKEQQVHKMGDIALLMMGAEESKFAKGLGKIGGMSQMVGTSMVGLGGTMGAIGSTMASLGGYAAMAGVAFEGLATIDEYTGGHLEHAGEALSNWAEHLLGVTRTTKDLEDAEALQAHYLGFKTAADYKAVEDLNKQAKLEQAYNYIAQRKADEIGALPINATHEALVEHQEALTKAAGKLSATTDLSGPEAYKLLEEATKHTADAVINRANREAELADMEQKVLNTFGALPLNATAEVLAARNEEIKNSVNHLVRANASADAISDDERESVLKSIMARDLHAEGIMSAIGRQQEAADEQAKMDQAVKMYAKLLPKVPLHATVNQMLAFNAAVAKLTAQAAESLGLKTADQVKELGQKLEKTQHHYDFRGSRFDIKQSFAEGFDPDRIAVAFSNDLATLGERKIMSGFSAPFGNR